MNSVTDVSRPLYGQLQKLTDTENSNVHVSATQSTQSYKVSKLSDLFTLLTGAHWCRVD